MKKKRESNQKGNKNEAVLILMVVLKVLNIQILKAWKSITNPFVNERAYAKKKWKEQMLLLKRVFIFQLSLKTKLAFLLKDISLRKISCKVSSWCLVACFSHLCFGLLRSPKAFWGAKSACTWTPTWHRWTYFSKWVPLRLWQGFCG